MVERELKHPDRASRSTTGDELRPADPRENAYCVGDRNMTDAEILMRHWREER